MFVVCVCMYVRRLCDFVSTTCKLIMQYKTDKIYVHVNMLIIYFNVCAAYDPRVGEPTARPTGGWVGHKSPPRRGGDSW